MRTQYWIAALSGCLLSAMAVFPNMALAQVRIGPMVIEEEARQGQAQGVIEVTNTGTETFRARVYALPFTYTRNGLEVVESSPSDLTPYLLFSPRELEIEPGQVRRIRLIARLLPSLGDGEYRAVIFTERLTPRDQETVPQQVSIVPRVGVTVYVRQGNTSVVLAAQAAQVDQESNQLYLLVSNAGNETARPRTRWSLSRNGTTVLSGESPETTVIAGGDRNVLIDYHNSDTPISPGQYTLSGNLSWQAGSLPFSFEVTIPQVAESTDQ